MWAGCSPPSPSPALLWGGGGGIGSEVVRLYLRRRTEEEWCNFNVRIFFLLAEPLSKYFNFS